VISVNGEMALSSVQVKIKNFGGLSAEEMTEQVMRDILDVRGNPPDIVKQQLVAFQGRLHAVLLAHTVKAMEQERLNIYGALMREGQNELANIVKDI
jgi:5,10-methylenetetrahydrofolate reductase